MKNVKVMLFALGALSLTISSCKKDDEPFVKPKLSFATDSETKKESDGTIEVTIALDKATDKDISISYSLDGTAIEKSNATTQHPAFDYEDLTEGEVIIAKGETSGVIKLKLYSDPYYENDETIDIDIDNVSYDKIEIVTTMDTDEITLTQEDGLLVGLEWGVGDGENYTNVDMDIILWAPNTSNVLVPTNITATSISVESPEVLFVPSILLSEGDYGFSYVYYQGDDGLEDMNFQTTLIEIIDGNDVASVTKKGTYHQENINPWDGDNGTDFIMEQSFSKVGTDYTDFSELTIPEAGSRAGAYKADENTKRVTKDFSSKGFSRFLKYPK